MYELRDPQKHTKYETFKNLDYLDKPKWFCIEEFKINYEIPF